MGRVFNFVMFMTVLTLIMQFAGFGSIGTSLSDLIGFVPGEQGTVRTGLNPGSSTLWNLLFNESTGVGPLGILILAAAAGIAIGFITKTASENYVILPFITTTMILFFDSSRDILTSLSKYPIWISGVIAVIYIPLTVGFIVTMVEWFRGNT